jgi:two-component system chemotaxis response regulator CheY
LARAQVPARKVGYACDGREALRKIKNQEFGLIIMDVVMPGMDGLEAIRAVKEASIAQDVPIMLVSGDLHNIVVKEAILLGVKHILAKPFGHRFFMERLFATLEIPLQPT